MGSKRWRKQTKASGRDVEARKDEGGNGKGFGKCMEPDMED